MSQFFIANTGGAPPPPGTVGFLSGQTGTNPVPPDGANNINIFAQDTTDNDADGIQTRGDIASNTVFVELTNRTRVIATTSDGAGQTQTVTVFTPVVASAITFVVSVTGYDSANNEMTGGELVGIARRSGGGVTVVIGTNDTFTESDTGLIASDYDVVTNGTLVQMQFVGVAGLTINWAAVFIYDQVQ